MEFEIKPMPVGAEVIGLDPDADPESMRRVLAKHAAGPAHVGTMTIPPQKQGAPASRPAHGRSADRRPSVPQG